MALDNLRQSAGGWRRQIAEPGRVSKIESGHAPYVAALCSNNQEPSFSVAREASRISRKKSMAAP
jgi:hypothetical protein